MSSGLKIDKLPGKLMKEHPETKSVHESRPQWMILVRVRMDATFRQKLHQNLGQNEQLVKCSTKFKQMLDKKKKCNEVKILIQKVRCYGI